MLCVIMVIEGWGRHCVCLQRWRTLYGSVHHGPRRENTVAQAAPPGGMPTRERGFMPPCFHDVGYDICTPCTGMCRRGLAGQHRVTHCTAQSSSGTLFGGTLYATARDTHTVPTPSLNYHDHTQHASFSCWLLDALVKSPLA